MPDNVGHAGGCPPALEGNDKTGIEGWAPGTKDLGGLDTDIIWEVVGLEICPGLCGVTMRSIINSMGLIESASERYPTGTAVERDGGVTNMSYIFLSISCAQRMVVWYCLFSSSSGENSSEKFKWVPSEAMACPIEVSQNGALGP